MPDKQTEVIENPTENLREIISSQETLTEALAPKKVSLAEIQASELFRRTQADRDRATAQVKKMETHLDDLTLQLNQMRSDQERMLLSEFQDEPKVKAIMSQQDYLRQELSKTSKKLRETEGVLERLAPVQKRMDAEAVAAQYPGIDVKELMEAESWDEMVGMAKVAYKLASKTETKTVEKKPEKVLPSHIDSGIQTASGVKGQVYKASEIQKMNPDERMKLGVKKAIDEGRIRWDE